MKPWIAIAVLLLAVAFGVFGWWRARPAKTDGSTNANAAADGAEETLFPEHVSWRKTSEFDPGGIYVLLRNNTKRPQRIASLALDDTPVIAWGVDQPREPEVPPERMFSRTPEGKPLPPPTEEAPATPEALAERRDAVRAAGFQTTYWARVLPEVIPPGGVAEVTLKLVTPMRRRVRLDVTPADAPAFTVLVHPEPAPLAVRLIVLPYARDRLYLYVKNDAPRALTPAGLEVNGRPATAWRSGDMLAPGEEGLLIHEPSKPFPAGELLFAKVATREGPTAYARTRALGGFALGMQFGASPPAFGLDPGTYTLAVPRQVAAWGLDDANTSEPPPYSVRAALPMDCPLCPLGWVERDRFKTARELLRRYAICAERFPFHPSLIHVCRINAEEGYALFAEAADVLSFNPSTTWTSTTKGLTEPPQATVAKLCRFGEYAAAPRPFVCMADAAHIGTRSGEDQAFATPYEFRTRLYTMLGLGAKGMLYRHNDIEAATPGAARLAPEIPRLNAEVRGMRDLLSIAAPYAGVKAEGWPALAAYGLLAGDRAIVLFLVRQEMEAKPGAADLRVSVPIPPWAKATAVARATPEGLVPLENVNLASEATFSVPLPADAEAYVVELREPQGTGNRQRATGTAGNGQKATGNRNRSTAGTRE